MIALPIAALLTLLFFRSVVAALLPIAIGGFTLASCAAIMRLGAHFTEIAIFALNVSAFLGLGLSIDYSLLLVQRFRQELGRGLSVKEAVANALDTAGRAVWVSGLAVIVSLAVLIGCPVAILRSVAIGGVLATLTALLGALVLLPALLAWLGPRVDFGHVGRSPEAIRAEPLLASRRRVLHATPDRDRARQRGCVDRDRDPGARDPQHAAPTRASSRTGPR